MQRGLSECADLRVWEGRFRAVSVFIRSISKIRCLYLFYQTTGTRRGPCACSVLVVDRYRCLKGRHYHLIAATILCLIKRRICRLEQIIHVVDVRCRVTGDAKAGGDGDGVAVNCH